MPNTKVKTSELQALIERLRNAYDSSDEYDDIMLEVIAALQAQAEEVAELKRQQEISSNHCRIYHVDAAKDDV